MSCWQPVNIGAVIVNDVGAIINILTGTLAIKELPIVAVAEIVNEVSPDQEKAPLPILVTLVGIVIDASPVHPWKATSPTDVTLVGIVIDASPIHCWNAAVPIVVILVGIVTDVSFAHK
jgi:hypothetical protein